MSAASEAAGLVLASLEAADAHDLLPEIAGILSAEAERRMPITVVSAVMPHGPDRDRLDARLRERFGDHPVEHTADPVLVSGFIARRGAELVDLSGRSAVADLERALTEPKHHA